MTYAFLKRPTVIFTGRIHLLSNDASAMRSWRVFNTDYPARWWPKDEKNDMLAGVPEVHPKKTSFLSRETSVCCLDFEPKCYLNLVEWKMSTDCPLRLRPGSVPSIKDR